MKTFSLSFLLTFVILVFISGCDKITDPGPGETNPALAKEKVDQANPILVQKVLQLAQTGPDSSSTDVSAAAALYGEALAADPNNADAHFGLALTDLISLFPTVADVTGSVSTLTPSTLLSILAGEANPSSVLTGIGTHMRTRIQDLARQQMETALGKRSPALVPGQTAHENLVQQEPPSYYQDIVENKILHVLTSAITHLTFVANTTGYAFLITPAMTGNATTETYRIDRTEIYLLLALVQGIKGEASVFVSYNVDYDPTNSAAVAQAWEVSSPFLALRPNGATNMQNARTNFVGMASSIQGSLNHLMNEPPNDEVDLINYNPADEAAFLEVIKVLDTVKTILSGPYTIPNGPTVNLKNFFDNAIPNYKEKVPPYTVSVVASSNPGFYDAILTWTATSFETWIFPDPTMNGLFPGMTDQEFKELLGLTANDWTQEVLIEG